MNWYHSESGVGTAVIDRPQLKGLTEEIVHSVVEIDADAWRQICAPEDLFMDLRLLQAVETSMQSTSRFRYVLYREDGAPVAAIVLCTFTIDIGVLADDQWSRWILGQFRKISRKLVEYRILFCGLPISACQSSIRFAPNADNAAILKRLDRTLRQTAKRDRASIIVLKEFEDREVTALKPIEQFGYRKADSLPTHLLELNGKSFEDYLLGIRSKSRHNIKHSKAKFQPSGIRFVSTSDVAIIEKLFTPEVYRFYESVLGRSKTKFEHLPPSFFLEMARELPDCCEFIFALQGERVCGFTISIFTSEVYHSLFIGFDDSINADCHLYFNLMLQGIVDAARHRVMSMEMGQNSDEVKRSKFCAVPQPRSIYVRGSNEWMNGVIGLLFKQLFPARSLNRKLAVESD